MVIGQKRLEVLRIGDGLVLPMLVSMMREGQGGGGGGGGGGSCSTKSLVLFETDDDEIRKTPHDSNTLQRLLLK